MAFSADGRILAMTRSQWVVSLIDPSDGRDLARLEHPDSQLISALAFSPSGTRLAVATEGHVIQLWDLHQLRIELASLKLDWDPSPVPNPPTHDEKPPIWINVIESR